jgi:hypothetical protein
VTGCSDLGNYLPPVGYGNLLALANQPEVMAKTIL